MVHILHAPVDGKVVVGLGEGVGWGDVGRGIERVDGLGYGVEAALRNDVAGERGADIAGAGGIDGRGSGVVDGNERAGGTVEVGEVAGALLRRRDGRDGVAVSDVVVLAPVDEEERPVAAVVELGENDGAADGSAVLVVAVGRADDGEGVAGVQTMEKALRASRKSLRKNSLAPPCRILVPPLVAILMTPPRVKPYSADMEPDWTLNSWTASTPRLALRSG